MLSRPQLTSANPSSLAELHKSNQAPSFNAAQEREYVRSFLLSNRALIRIACVLSVLVPASRALENTLNASWPTVPSLAVNLAIAAFVLSGSLVLACISLSSAFERLYLPLAQAIVPVRNCLGAIPITTSAAQGQLELLMILPAMVLGPFFFLGLPFRTALVSALLTVTSFAISALYFDLSAAVILRSCAFLLLIVVGCAIAARQTEKWSRKSFVESRLIWELAEHDALTGTKNRRVLDEHLQRLWRQAINDRRQLAIALIDVDHFKAYNDLYGHQAGDQALRRVAQTLQTFVSRPLDLLARYGGEEFAIVFYDTNASQATEIAEHMLRAVHTLAIEHRGSPTFNAVTVSIGLGVLEPSEHRDPRGALQLADEALYQAKVGGRNRVEIKSTAEYDALVTGIFSRRSLARS